MRRRLRIAIHQLVRRPTFTLAAVGTLAVGIGATTAVFSTVNATLLRPLPYRDSAQLYTLNTGFVDGRWTSGRVAGAYFTEIAETSQTIDRAVALAKGEAIILGDDGRNQQVLTYRGDPRLLRSVRAPNGRRTGLRAGGRTGRRNLVSAVGADVRA